MKPELQLAHDLAKFRTDPLGCALYSFPWNTDKLAMSDGPRVWQRDVMQEIREHLESRRRFQPLKIAVASGHGIGKSSLVGMLNHWAMSTCDDCRGVVTANTEPQLSTKLWPEVNKWFSLAVNKNWFTQQATIIHSVERGHQDSWRLDRVTWSENNTEAFQGLHNLGKRIMVTFDEASGIADKVWEATEGALTDEDTEIIWLAFSNPTQHSGAFRRCFGSQSHRWLRHNIDSRTVPGVNLTMLNGLVEDFGEDSDVVRVRVRGEFPRAAAGQFIPQDIVAKARLREVAYTNEPKIMSVDVARYGDDASSVGIRQGQNFDFVHPELRGLSTAELSMRVMAAIREHTPRMCIIDGDGIGGAVVDYILLHFSDWMKKRPWFRIMEFHGAASPGDKFMWLNKRAEVWGRMREWLKTGSIPDKPTFETELTGVSYFHSRKNQIQLERKEDMKARGMASPNMADCFIAGTQVLTPKGEVSIEDLQIGDWITTPYGASRLVLMHKTETEVLSTLRYADHVLIGKPTHEIFSQERGRIALSDVSSDTIVIGSLFGRALWRLATIWFTRGESIGFKAVADITCLGLRMTPSACFIVGFMWTLTVLYRKVFIFITKMATAFITLWRILSLSSPKNMLGCTGLLTETISESLNLERKNWPVRGTLQWQAVNGIRKTPEIYGATRLHRPASVACAAHLTNLFSPREADFAQTLASKKRLISAIRTWQRFALYVGYRFNLLAGRRRNSVRANVQTVFVSPTKTYNLTLEDCNAYFASGILVFNCLAMSFAGMPLGETRDERVEREQAAITDPLALYFARLAETERRAKMKQPLEYWM